jgi:hypothetical protein
VTTRKHRVVLLRPCVYVSCPAILRIASLSLVLLALVIGPADASNDPPKNKKEPKPYALIFGTVWGPDDRPVYGVHVRIRRASEKKSRWEAYSDHHGEFAQRLPAGKQDYVVWADLEDYKPLDKKELHSGQEVQVHIEYEERADIGLHLK